MSDLTGTVVTHRRYLPYTDAHYAGNLVNGAFSLDMFGDVATEMCIVTDSDEGLFAGYSEVKFLAPVYAGDVLEIEAKLIREGRRSREMTFESRVVCRAAHNLGKTDAPESASFRLDEPIVAATATGTVIVPQARA